MAASRLIAPGACIGPWGATASDLVAAPSGGARAPDASAVPPVPGFIESRFNPLVYAVVKRTLAQCAPAVREKTAIALGSLLGDATTADVASQNVVKGNVHNPLLFYQSVPTSILGYLARELGIKGPLPCISSRSLTFDLLEIADILLEDDDVEQVLVVGVELAPNARTERVLGILHGAQEDGRPDVAPCYLHGAQGEAGAPADVAVSLVVRRAPDDAARGVAVWLDGVERLDGEPVADAVADDPPAGAWARPANARALWGLIDLCIACERLKTAGAEATARVLDRAWGSASRMSGAVVTLRAGGRAVNLTTEAE